MLLHTGYLLQERYRIMDILGVGGMGAVYRARDENLDITVAVKENSFLTDEYARQFQREARILASLRHPNLPRVFDYFVIEQQGQYLVMDYIEGVDLNQWIREDKLSEYDALQIGLAICNALIYLHEQNPPITHRDIKPGNIKITPAGEIVLVDFGLVKVLSDKEVTTTAARAMTPGYSPPEQYGDMPTDQRSDLFSLGATLYAALAGKLPEDSLSRTTGKLTLTPLRKHQPDVSQKTAVAIEKALSLKFEDRWQSAREFKSALIKSMETLPVEDHSSDRALKLTFDMEDTGIPVGKIRGNFDHKRAKRLKRGHKKSHSGRIVLSIALLVLILIAGTWLIYPEIFSWNQAGLLLNPVDSFGSRWFDPLEDMAASDAEVHAIEEIDLTETPLPDEEATPIGAAMITPTLDPAEIVTLTPMPTPMGGGPGLIAFVSERTGRPQIWLLDIRTGNTTQMTHLQDGACQPDWSPDGQKIVFTSPCLGKRESHPGSNLHITELDTRIYKPLTTSLEGDFSPAWSPDGNWIAYTTIINGLKQIRKINPDNLEIVELSSGGYNDSDPAWSPDGKQLAFSRLKVFGQIWIMDSDGGNPIQCSRSGEIDNSNPVWYPKEDLILFSQVLGVGSPSKQIYGLRIEDIGKQGEHPILPAGRLEYIPLMDNVDVSSDGYWLVFDYWFFDTLENIYAMAFPGSTLLQLTDHPAKDYEPVWCPSS